MMVKVMIDISAVVYILFILMKAVTAVEWIFFWLIMTWKVANLLVLTGWEVVLNSSSVVGFESFPKSSSVIGGGANVTLDRNTCSTDLSSICIRTVVSPIYVT